MGILASIESHIPFIGSSSSDTSTGLLSGAFQAKVQELEAEGAGQEPVASATNDLSTALSTGVGQVKSDFSTAHTGLSEGVSNLAHLDIGTGLSSIFNGVESAAKGVFDGAFGIPKDLASATLGKGVGLVADVTHPFKFVDAKAHGLMDHVGLGGLD